MLKVRRPERKMSGFRTVRIPRILWTSGLDIMFGRALIWTNNCKIIWPEIKWPLKILKISENLFSKLILHDQECWIPPECKINLLNKFSPIFKVFKGQLISDHIIFFGILFLTVLKVWRPERKMSGLRTVRILRILRTSRLVEP